MYSSSQRESVQMDFGKERHITKLLHNIRTADSIAPQPSQSYQNPERDDWFGDSDDSDDTFLQPKKSVHDKQTANSDFMIEMQTQEPGLKKWF